MTPVAISRFWGGSDWSRMAAVLGASLARFCPDWTLDIAEVRGYRPAGKLEGNSWKLEEWVRAALRYPDGTEILLLDADSLIGRSLDPLWSRAFDVALTLRPKGSRFPLNAGFVALRLSDATRRFLDLWLKRNRELMADAVRLRQLRGKYGGPNQSALCSLYDEGALKGLEILWLDCAEWNCEDTTWAEAGPRTRIVHVKDGLRRCALGYPGRYSQHELRLAAAWRRIEGEVEHGPQGIPRRAQAGR